MNEPDLQDDPVRMYATRCPSPIDTLTGCLRTTALLADASGRIASWGSVAWLRLDIVNFAGFNREHGYLAGDTLVRTLADRVRGMRPDDVVARDSDAFILIGVPDARRAAVAAVAAELSISLTVDAGEASSLTDLVDQLGI